VLLRLACLGVTNVFALLRLLPMSDHGKDAKILALRHQIGVLERQLAGRRVRFTPGDRAFPAALLRRLPTEVRRGMRLLVRPDTVTRRHRDLLARRHAARSRPKRSGRPHTVRSIRALILRLARENPGWGYQRIHGELLVLGVQVAASTVWEILKDAGIDPAPERAATTWAGFLRSQADALPACDFFKPSLCPGRGCTGSPCPSTPAGASGPWAPPHTRPWVTQATKNLVMDLEDTGRRARFLILIRDRDRDRDGKSPALFDTVLKDAGIDIALTSVRTPRMNALMERWVQTCRHELLDRTLI
jgi:putative transposase